MIQDGHICRIEGDTPRTESALVSKLMQSAPVCPAALRRRRRSLNSNRLLVTVIANREIRVARNARLQPTAFAIKDVEAISKQIRIASRCKMAA